MNAMARQPGWRFWAAGGLLVGAVSAANADGLEIEQITGNLQTTYQAGSNNSTTVEQSAIAAGALAGGNAALVGQFGSQNQATVRQEGADLGAVVGQAGAGNSAVVDQSGSNLKAAVGQFGSGHAVEIHQMGVGNGLPLIVNQY